MTEISKNDEERSVSSAIDDFRGILVDMTTDYALQAMIEAGFQKPVLDRLYVIVRPWIEFYGREFSGIVDDELVKIEREIRIDFGRRNFSVPEFYSALLKLSGGPDSLLWPTRLAMRNVVEYIGEEAKTASPAPLRDLWVRLDERVAEVVVLPTARSKAVYGPLREAWRQRSRSHWDDLVGHMIYDHLDVLPGIDSLIENRIIREFSYCVIKEFSAKERLILYESTRRHLEQDRPIGLSRTDMPEAMDFDMIAKATDEALKTVRGVLRRSGNAR